MFYKGQDEQHKKSKKIETSDKGNLFLSSTWDKQQAYKKKKKKINHALKSNFGRFPQATYL